MSDPRMAGLSLVSVGVLLVVLSTFSTSATDQRWFSQLAVR